MKKNLFVFAILFFLVLIANEVYSQAKINPFAINSSQFFENVKSHKSAYPNQTLEEFVNYANYLLQKDGINFVFAFNAETYQKLKESKENQKDKSVPLNLKTSLFSIGGDGNPTPLVLPEAKFDGSQCFSCYIQLPVFEITETTFVTTLMERNIGFNLPRNFLTNEIHLVDENDLNKTLRKWKVPYLARSVSVSNDGNVIYLPFPDNELKDLTLVVFPQGTFSVIASKDVDADVKISSLENVPNNTNQIYLKFEFEDKNQIIRFVKACNN